MRAKLAKGVCSRCSRVQAVRRDGTMFSHGTCPDGTIPAAMVSARGPDMLTKITVIKRWQVECDEHGIVDEPRNHDADPPSPVRVDP